MPGRIRGALFAATFALDVSGRAAIRRLVEEQRTACASPLADIGVASTTDTSRCGASYVEMAEAQ